VQEEEEELEAETRASKRARAEMKRRGLTAVPRKGENIEHDKAEKALARLATRGVVRLFNAVAKVQGEGQGEKQNRKSAQSSRASFFGALDGGAQKSSPDGPKVGRESRGRDAQGGSAEEAPEWDALREGNLGQLAAGKGFKDWDQLGDEDGEDAGARESLDEEEMSESEGGEGEGW